ncbi:diacylglycerol kinase [Neptunicoccus sediminis]|uniref:diacylglycerol kinase n=1 Tax=Neptunicoccus sediminis TaxID=1892596 RepID=UPI000846222C|nr:diacylglycerol kinase [Neptunicoccus sediminis]
MTDLQPKPKPAPVHGFKHIFAAAGYSFDGLIRLMKETAFRLELFGFFAALIAFVMVRAQYWEFAILTGLFLLLVAVEALNTAVECLTDHLAPNWEAFAKEAKDLGSLAVLCLLLLCTGFIGLTLLRHLING